MSVVTSKIEPKAPSKSSSNIHSPYILAIGGIGLLIAIWAVATIGTVAHGRLLIQLFVLNSAAQLGIIAIRRTGMAFSTSQAINLATVAVFGVQGGILVALFSSIAVWIVMTIRKKQPIRLGLQTLVFNAGVELIALFISGTLLLSIRNQMPADWLILKPADWFLAAIVNDQLTVFMISGLVYLQKKVRPREFWRHNSWAMPINITIGALGGALLSAAVADMGFRGILTFMVPLVLSAYAFHMYVRSADNKFSMIRSRTSDLEIANQHLTSLAESKEKAIDTLSAELQLSLTAIRTSVRPMIDTQNYIPRERQLALLEQIAAATQELSGTIDRIGRADHMAEHASGIPKMRMFNFSEMVQGTFDSFKRVAEENQVRVRCYAGDVPIYLEADEQMMREAVRHLISNAVTYTPAGGSVFVSLAINENNVTLEIEDTGSGINKSEIPRIFERYYRGKEHEDSTQGTGMGLATVRQIVQAHDGSIEVESQVSLGSRFILTMPMQESIRPRDSDMMLGASMYTTQEFFIHARETVSA